MLTLEAALERSVRLGKRSYQAIVGPVTSPVTPVTSLSTLLYWRLDVICCCGRYMYSSLARHSETEDNRVIVRYRLWQSIYRNSFCAIFCHSLNFVKKIIDISITSSS